MKLPSSLFYLAATVLLLLGLFSFVLYGRFQDCVRDIDFDPLSAFMEDEMIREECSDRMFPFSFFFQP